jgi:hypothetical protein
MSRLPRFFTQYWTNSTWIYNAAVHTPGALLDHSAGNQFRDRGVTKDDEVYIVTVLEGVMHLLGKIRVGSVCDQAEAATALGTTPDSLWEANDHILAAAATPMDFGREVPLVVAEALRFVSGDGESKPLKFSADGVIDSQTLRGVR